MFFFVLLPIIHQTSFLRDRNSWLIRWMVILLGTLLLLECLSTTTLCSCCLFDCKITSCSRYRCFLNQLKQNQLEQVSRLQKRDLLYKVTFFGKELCNKLISLKQLQLLVTQSYLVIMTLMWIKTLVTLLRMERSET
jgi:hypothetical protein